MQLHRDRDRFEESGAQLVVIGQGTPRQAAHFRKTLRVDLPLLVDPDRRSYAAAGAKRATTSELIGPRMLAKGVLHSAASGVRQGKVVGDAAQLGGVLVVAPDGTVAWAHMADDAGDNPSTDEILAAARRAAERA